MHTCTICHFETELDDVVAVLATGQCIYLSALLRPQDGRRAVHAERTAPPGERRPRRAGGGDVTGAGTRKGGAWSNWHPFNAPTC